MAICGRSGIETLKSKLILDGYFHQLWVLPEYYEKEQPIHYRPKPELPPFNPQPLIDVYPQTVNLGQISNTPPYSLITLGKFGFNVIGDVLTSLEVISSLGSFEFMHSRRQALDSIQVTSETKIYTPPSDISTGYGIGGYGENTYGGYVDTGPDFLIGFNGVSGGASNTATGQFLFGIGTGYGIGGYGESGYGE